MENTKQANDGCSPCGLSSAYFPSPPSPYYASLPSSLLSPSESSDSSHSTPRDLANGRQAYRRPCCWRLWAVRMVVGKALAADVLGSMLTVEQSFWQSSLARYSRPRRPSPRDLMVTLPDHPWLCNCLEVARYGDACTSEPLDLGHHPVYLALRIPEPHWFEDGHPVGFAERKQRWKPSGAFSMDGEETATRRQFRWVSYRRGGGKEEALRNLVSSGHRHDGKRNTERRRQPRRQFRRVSYRRGGGKRGSFEKFSFKR